MGDAGLTGRKIIVDTYGGAAPHGGGAFSGKDPTKVDRSAAYAARYVAKNVVAAGLAERCQIQVAYAIGVAHPFSIYVDCFGTEHRRRSRGSRSSSREHFDLRPAAILRDLDLRRPIYAKTAAYGHFGRDDHDFTWERDRQGRRAARRPPGSRAVCRLAGSRRGRTKSPAAAFSPIACSPPSSRTLELPGGGLAPRRARRSRPGRAPGRRTSAGGRRRARRGGRSSRACPGSSAESGSSSWFSACSKSVSIGQPCGQRSGLPSFALGSARPCRR